MSDSVHRSELEGNSQSIDPSPMSVEGSFLRKLAFGAMASLLLAPAALLIDIGLARWWRSNPLPGDFTRAIELTEVFAHGIGVAYLLIGLSILVPRVRGYLPRLAALAYGAGAFATIVKVFVIRARPHSLLNVESIGWQGALNLHFDPTLERIAVFDTLWRSFPSGHTATAVGLVVGLTLLFPRGRYYFASIATLAIMQRVSSNAHYLSDVLVGVSVGFLWSVICLHPYLLGTLLRQMEPEGPRTHSDSARSTVRTLPVTGAQTEPGSDEEAEPQRKAA